MVIRMSSPTIYAIMITGKDERRISFARLIGIKNFDTQTYKNKKMIIINHGVLPVLTSPRKDIYELMVNKGPMTLGDLRNIALELVPYNNISLVWDDDDWRSPDYMQHMIKHLLSSKSMAVFMKNRLEYNLANGYTFRSSFSTGNTHVMMLKVDKMRYMPKDTLEDTHLQSNIKEMKKKYLALENDPRMYVRIIHQNNTSPFASDARNDIVKYSPSFYYQEHNATSEQKDYATDTINKHYGFFKYK